MQYTAYGIPTLIRSALQIIMYIGGTGWVKIIYIIKDPVYIISDSSTLLINTLGFHVLIMLHKKDGSEHWQQPKVSSRLSNRFGAVRLFAMGISRLVHFPFEELRLAITESKCQQVPAFQGQHGTPFTRCCDEHSWGRISWRAAEWLISQLTSINYGCNNGIQTSTN